MKKLQLLITLRRHIRLSEKRSPIFEQNQRAKYVVYSIIALAIVYLLSFSATLAYTALSSSTDTPCELLFIIAPFCLVFDFLIRFAVQNTPAQLTKPYSLLPISKYACVECFVLSSITTSNNLLWMVFTIPYVILTASVGEGFIVSAGMILSFQILITINSQWYMLVRSLINKNLAWWLLPISVYAIAIAPSYFISSAQPFFISQLDTIDIVTWLGNHLAHWHLWSWIIILCVLAVFIEANKRLQYRFTYTENANSNDKPLKSISQFRMFDKYGTMGEFLKLELLSLIRNKNIRKTFIASVLLVSVFSVLISFTNWYDDLFSKSFYIVFTFTALGAMTLIKIMCAEGNFIDGIMVRSRENIFQLLRAKYYFYSAILILPFLLMLPTLFTGKYSLLMLLSMMCFAVGPVYCLLMQMAVYNSTTIPLNTKFTTSKRVGTNYIQIIVEILAILMPTAIIWCLSLLFDSNTVYLTLLLIGIIFIASHKLWIRNIYKRLMLRRYDNMEGFRGTR